MIARFGPAVKGRQTPPSRQLGEGGRPGQDGVDPELFRPGEQVAVAGEQGLPLIDALLDEVRVGLEVEQCARDGQRLAPKTVFLKAFGSAGRIHAVYKTAQNIMEYCSGIATRTADMIAAAQAVNPKCRVVTTRKHFPGTKVLSLYAVQTAGATEHRTGLSESVLVFDQHRTFCGDDFLQTLAQMRERDPERKIAVEAASFDEALAFAKAGADIIQCEKFSVELFARTASALKEVRPQVLVSAAGGLRADNAADYARAGADFLVTTWPYFGRPYDIKMSIEGLGC